MIGIKFLRLAANRIVVWKKVSTLARVCLFLFGFPAAWFSGCLFYWERGMSETKRPVGRPTKYKAEYAEQARKLCLLGATDAEMADFFEIAESTLHEWKHQFSEFSESIKKGKLLADANIADRLYQRAMGYEAPDVDIRVVGGEIVETPLTKYYPPDTPAAIFWLKNRQRGKWRDRMENEVSGSLNVENLADLSDEEVKARAEELGYRLDE